MPKKEKSPRPGRGEGRVQERASSRRQDDSSEETLAPVARLLFLSSRRRQPFLHFPLLLIPARGSLALPLGRSSSPKSVLQGRHKNREKEKER